MSEVNIQERIQKRCLALAKDLLGVGPQSDNTKELIVRLVRRAFEHESAVSRARSSYDWFIKNKVPNELAWKFSGMEDLVAV